MFRLLRERLLCLTTQFSTFNKILYILWFLQQFFPGIFLFTFHHSFTQAIYFRLFSQLFRSRYNVVVCFANFSTGCDFVFVFIFIFITLNMCVSCARRTLASCERKMELFFVRFLSSILMQLNRFIQILVSPGSFQGGYYLNSINDGKFNAFDRCAHIQHISRYKHAFSIESQ